MHFPERFKPIILNIIMKICLKTYAKQSGQQRAVIKLQERLPERISHPCELTCDFNVASFDNYFLLTLDIAGAIDVTCQRCLQPFPDDYYNRSTLAVCINDTVAESLMEHFECIVSDDNQVDLADIVADDLHLFSPEKHDNSTDCSVEMSQWIGGEST